MLLLKCINAESLLIFLFLVLLQHLGKMKSVNIILILVGSACAESSITTVVWIQEYSAAFLSLLAAEVFLWKSWFEIEVNVVMHTVQDTSLRIKAKKTVIQYGSDFHKLYFGHKTHISSSLWRFSHPHIKLQFSLKV